MMAVHFKVSSEVANLADTVNKNLVDNVLYKAMDRAAKHVQTTLIPELPDSRVTGTHRKKSKAVRERFPNHMRDQTGVKRLRKLQTAVGRVIGIRSPGDGGKGAGQVNFDHGKKAMTTGRVHKLWWVDGVHEKYARVNPRVQRKDIAKIVIRRAAPVVEQIVAEDIRKAKLL